MNVPSGAEIVMEGKILSDKTHPEWMVEMLQTYDHKRSQPIFELENLHFFHRIQESHGKYIKINEKSSNLLDLSVTVVIFHIFPRFQQYVTCYICVHDVIVIFFNYE